VIKAVVHGIRQIGKRINNCTVKIEYYRLISQYNLYKKNLFANFARYFSNIGHTGRKYTFIASEFT